MKIASSTALWALGFVSFASSALTAEAQKYQTHPPMRPLPAAVERAHEAGPARFVDPAKGDDAADGSEAEPWRTLKHALSKLGPGDTLYLRGGVYHENVSATLPGTEAKPITIRAASGELAIVDGGLAEFLEKPSDAWEPAPEGAPGEFRSTKTFPGLNVRNEGLHVMGLFAESMVPLHAYNLLGDLRSDNIYWNIDNKLSREQFIYCGPGVFYDPASERIHVRLAPTKMPYFPESQNYRGESDPRRTPLVIGGMSRGPALTLRDCRYVRVFDLVVRGAAGPTLTIEGGHQLALDGLTVYGGSTAMRVADTSGLRMTNCALRGIAAPWTFRGSLKYRALEARIFSASDWTPSWPGNRDFELAHCEFTDSVDGVFIGNVARCRFHHNLVDNVSDDGIFLTAGTAFDGTTPGGGHEIYQNRLARCLTTFAFGVGHGRQRLLADTTQTGAMTFIARNVFDLRAPVPYGQPIGPDVPQEITTRGRVCGDHGSPAWEPMAFYHNTVLEGETPFRGGYGNGMGGHFSPGVARRVMNNIFLGVRQPPGNVLPEVAPGKDNAPGEAPNLKVDGNVHGCLAEGFEPAAFTELLRRTAQNADARTSQSLGWASRDRVADPRLRAVSADTSAPLDVRLADSSPAREAGVAIDPTWPDAIRSGDKTSLDAGAIPFGGEPWSVGVRGRLDVNGAERTPLLVAGLSEIKFLPNVAPVPEFTGRRAVIVSGYPAPDAPLVEYALQRAGYTVEVLEKTWLETDRYGEYAVVVIIGDLPRAQLKQTQYTAEDTPRVAKFLQDGGTLLMLYRGKDVFRFPEARTWLNQQIGLKQNNAPGEIRIALADHPWAKELAASNSPWWETLGNVDEFALRAERGEQVLADKKGHSLLFRHTVGKGQLVYLGWSPAGSMPTAKNRTVRLDQEASFAAQMGLLMKIARSGEAEK